MAITVVVRSAEGAPPSLTFDGNRVVLGRSDGCDVRLPDPSVSLRHATLRQSGSEYSLVDEGSTNGTFVNESPLAPRTPTLLNDRTTIRVGNVKLFFRYVSQTVRL